jgi:XTP/dITP diphosphohydrolase
VRSKAAHNSRPRVALATTNAHKAAEIRAAVGVFVELVDLPLNLVAPAEGSRSLVANARAKATAASQSMGLPALADDTGFFIDALGGRPGIRAARYAAEVGSYDHAIRRLLEQLRTTTGVGRSARFTTCAVLLDAGSNGSEVVAYGTLRGSIARRPAGDGGFGYDSIFLPSGESMTLAQLPTLRSARISHRTAAFSKLVTAEKAKNLSRAAAAR